MERLKGKTLLIGKEPGHGRLLVAVAGGGKSVALGAAGSVYDSVSRCLPNEGVAHVKLEIDKNGGMILTNFKVRNITTVNGTEIVSKRIKSTDKVELGKDHFAINIQAILEAATKLLPPPPLKFDISHLNNVWEENKQQRKDVQARQKKINLIRTGCSIFTMCAMPVNFLFGPIGMALTGIGIIGTVYSFVGLKNDKTADILEKIGEDFQDRYVCPNPKCGKFLGNMSYKLLKKQYSMHCPHCKCEFIEKEAK